MILLQSPMIIASILLIIGTIRKSVIIKKISYALIALFGLGALIALLISIITATTGEGIVFAMFVFLGVFFMLLAGIVLFFTTQRKNKLLLILAIVSIIGLCVGLMTIFYLPLIVAGLLINYDGLKEEINED